MFGDDPDPTVMTEWVGFGEVFGRARGSENCAEWWSGKRSRRQGCLMGSDKREKRAVREKVMKAKGETTTTTDAGFTKTSDAICMMA